MKTVKNIVRACLRKFGYDVYQIDRFRITSLSAGPDPDYEKHLAENASTLLTLGLNKAHYGCGSSLFENDWVNIDFNPGRFDSTKIYIRTDLTSKHPLPSNHFCFAFAEDFLEHLTQDESLIFLSEAFRCLETGGVLRLSFPGLRGVLQKHYLRSDYEGASLGREEAFTLWDHKHFYCEESLAIVAKNISSFSDIQYVTYGTSVHKELRNLDSRADQQDLNIHVELTK